MCRTVTLTVKSKDLGKVLGSLEMSKEFVENTTLTLTIDIEDTKKNYQALCGMNEILEWDFVDNEIPTPPQQEKENMVTDMEEVIKSVKESLEKKPEELIFPVPSPKLIREEAKKLVKDYIRTYDDIIEFILLSWRLSKVFEEFSIDLVGDHIIPGIIKNQTDISEVSSLDRRIVFMITSYYAGVTTDKIVEDVIMKIQDSWEVLSDIANVESLVMLLFGTQTKSNE